MTGRRHERGLALVVVLWGIAALSLIAGAMLASAVNSARIGHNAWSQLKVQTAADTGVQAAILSLFDPDPAHGLALDGRAQKIASAEGTVIVSIQDEAGRIDLNFAGRALLRDYFRSAGMDADAAEALADRVIDWRSPKGARSLNGASAGDYDKAGYAWRPRGAPFQSVDELSLVMGMTPDLFRRLAPGLTVYSHMASFDTNYAPKEVLAVIAGMNQQGADQAVANRPPARVQSGHAFVVIATAEAGRMRFTRRAVVLISGDPARPFWMLDWK